jgi:CRP-like cAMP-binding protein
MVRLLAEDENSNVHELRQVSENDFFGALSLMGDFRRMETAQAVTETYVLGLFSPDLKTLLKRNPTVGAAVMNALAKHLAEQQVALVQRLAKSEGAVSARRLLRGAERRGA